MKDRRDSIKRLLDFGAGDNTSTGFVNVSGDEVELIDGVRFIWFAVNYKDDVNKVFANPFANFDNKIQVVNKGFLAETWDLLYMSKDTLGQMEDKANAYYKPDNKGKSYKTIKHILLQGNENVWVMDYYNTPYRFKMFFRGDDIIEGFKCHLMIFKKFLELNDKTKKLILTCSDVADEYNDEYDCIFDLRFKENYRLSFVNFFNQPQYDRAREIWSDSIRKYLFEKYPKLYSNPAQVDENHVMEYMKMRFEEEYIKNWCVCLESITGWMTKILSAYKTYCQLLNHE